MPRYIDAEKLCKLARNNIGGTVDANDIMRFPTADVQEVRHGGWIFRGDYTSMCSCCNNDVDVDHEKEPKYCPECGAKMDAGE